MESEGVVRIVLGRIPKVHVPLNTILPWLGLCISLGTPTLSLPARIISQDTSYAPSGMAIFTCCDSVWFIAVKLFSNR
jgi:hypothetical protein